MWYIDIVVCSGGKARSAAGRASSYILDEVVVENFPMCIGQHSLRKRFICHVPHHIHRLHIDLPDLALQSTEVPEHLPNQVPGMILA